MLEGAPVNFCPGPQQTLGSPLPECFSYKHIVFFLSNKLNAFPPVFDFS